MINISPSIDMDTKEHKRKPNIKWIKRLIEKNTGVGSGLGILAHGEMSQASQAVRVRCVGGGPVVGF